MDSIDKINKLGAELVPEQKTGSEMDVCQKLQLSSLDEAASFYQIVKSRLLDVNKWYDIAQLPVSAFKLFDCSGRVAERTARQGDFIRIDIPGPGSKTGKGYDWVHIEVIAEESGANSEAITMRVRPNAHPLGDDEHVAHFLKSCATSTFQVKRAGMLLTAEEHGRNEVANVHTGYLLDNIRNALVGVSAKIGLSYPQWKSLVKGLLESK